MKVFTRQELERASGKIDTLGRRHFRKLTPIQKFWNKVVMNPNGCWDWTGSKKKKLPYGVISVRGTNVLAHRFSWMYFKGPVSVGLQVCHHCDRPSCVNPDHLFLGTNRDNQIDSIDKKRHPWSPRQFCIRGHEFTEKNTHSYVNYNGRIARQCRECANIRRRKT